VSADAEGEYRFLELPAGEYEVSAVAPGFRRRVFRACAWKWARKPLLA